MSAKLQLEKVLEELRTVEARKPSEGFRRGELKMLFEYLADKYDLSFNSVRNVYYKEVRNKSTGFTLQPIQQVRQVRQVAKPITPFYKIGQIVQVRVKNLLDYGAFVETTDGNKVEGLIHISEVKREYVESIYDYFEVGDIVHAKVKKIAANQKVEFSTKDLNITIEKEKKTQDENSLSDILTFLNGMVGALSPKAKTKLHDLIKEHGVFKFTMGMMQAGKVFENDLGLILLEQIQEKIEDCL